MSTTESTDASRLAWAAVRGVMGLLLLAAVAAQARATIERTVGLGRDLATTMANFFSYFTILSNIFCAVVLLLAAWWMTRPRSKPQDTAGLAVLLACATTYMVVTGVVYNLLLRGIMLDQGTTVPWSNEVMHLVGPAFMLLDALCEPRPRALPWKSVALVLMFPLAWLGYTFIRAPLVTAPTTGTPWWYPYPFLDHHLQGGFGPVAGYVVGIAVAIAAVAFAVIALGRWRNDRTAASGQAMPDTQRPAG